MRERRTQHVDTGCHDGGQRGGTVLIDRVVRQPRTHPLSNSATQSSCNHFRYGGAVEERKGSARHADTCRNLHSGITGCRWIRLPRAWPLFRAAQISDPIVLASCSSSAIRETLIPGRPISRIIVICSPDLRALAVILSVEMLNDIASNPIFRAIASTHSRVRAAVLPARIIKVPNNSSASTASPDAMGFLRTSFPEVEAIRILSSIYAARTVACRTHEWQAGRASIGWSKRSYADPTRV